MRLTYQPYLAYFPPIEAFTVFACLRLRGEICVVADVLLFFPRWVYVSKSTHLNRSARISPLGSVDNPRDFIAFPGCLFEDVFPIAERLAKNWGSGGGGGAVEPF